jgi:hypothetical protein
LSFTQINEETFSSGERIMSKRQAILESLLGAAELNGNQTVADKIRDDIANMTRSHQADGYERLAFAATGPKRAGRKAA